MNIAFGFKVLFLLLFSYRFSVIVVNVLVILMLSTITSILFMFFIHFISGYITSGIRALSLVESVR
jgi:hypothetical protein